MTRNARSAAHFPVGRLNGVPRMGTPPTSVSDRDEARASEAVTDLVERPGSRSPSSVTRRCYCGARIRRGRLGLEWVHVERRIGNPHYAHPARLSEGRRGFPPNPDAPPSA